MNKFLIATGLLALAISIHAGSIPEEVATVEGEANNAATV